MTCHTVTVAELATGILLAPNPPHARVLGAASDAEYTVSFSSVEDADAFAVRLLSERADIEAWVAAKGSGANTRFYVENGIIMKQNRK